jgi:hypothetical protein
MSIDQKCSIQFHSLLIFVTSLITYPKVNLKGILIKLLLVSDHSELELVKKLYILHNFQVMDYFYSSNIQGLLDKI